mmetsp:Transcript_17522/g.26089  ORF Transcript_17522/g.26089 Transcript_17522/m.26089 type:complete len:313 (-) Transcript_17522:111-1049(-)
MDAFPSTYQEQQHERALQRANKVCALDQLPVDLWQITFSFLPLSNMCNVFTVCQEWFRIGEDAMDFWQMLYRTRFQNKAHVPLDLPQSVQGWKAWCAHRVGLNMEYSTRTKMWKRNTGNVAFLHDQQVSSFTADNIVSIRGEDNLPEYNGTGWHYFEATIWGQASVGIVSLQTEDHRRAYGYNSRAHVGWCGVSYGYHADDGMLYSNISGSRYAYSDISYGPEWGNERNGTVVGCGYNLQTSSLFFTLNGASLGYLPKPVAIVQQPYTAGISLHALGSRAEVNVGREPFTFDFDLFCKEETSRGVADRTPIH